MRPFASVLFALALALSFGGCDPREWFMCSLGYCGYAVDDVAPQRPAQVVASAGDRTVTLSWRASEEPDFFSYTVGRSATPGGPYTDVGSSFEPGFTDTYLLANGTTYYYVVRARDEASNEGPDSFEVAATPVPPAPRPRLAAPVLSVTRFFDHLQLSWTGVPGASAYRLSRSLTPGGSYSLITDTSAGFHFDENVEGGTRYYYVISAVDSSGQVGEQSNEVSASPEFNPGPPLSLLTTWGGERGQGPGEFWLPRGITTDASANVYVTDNTPEIARVQKFTSTGTFVTAWFVGPTAHGIATDAAGNVYVAIPSGNLVRKYTATGAFIAEWGAAGAGQGQFNTPTGIAIDAAGGVYVADSGNRRVQKFTTAGTFVLAWAVGAGARGVATDAGGNVYVADRTTNRVSKYTSDGTFVLELDEGFSAPEGVVVDPSGRVAVADTGNDRVSLFTGAGVFGVAFGGFEGPNGVAADCASNLYVLDAGNFRVRKFGAAAPATCPAAPGFAPVARAAQARRPGFEATMTTTASAAGAVSSSSGLTRERGAGARGSFRGRIVGRTTASTRAFRAFARGSWRARFDIVTDPRTGKSTASGVALVTSSRRRGGQLCLRFSLKLAVSGRKVTSTGSFSTLGGSGAARTLRAAGNFDQTLGSERFTLLGNAAPGRRGAGRSLPAVCRRLC